MDHLGEAMSTSISAWLSWLMLLPLQQDTTEHRHAQSTGTHRVSGMIRDIQREVRLLHG
jgi:hypothetical protein